MSLRSVVFPAPFAPISPIFSVGLIWKVTSRNTSCDPNDVETLEDLLGSGSVLTLGQNRKLKDALEGQLRQPLDLFPWLMLLLLFALAIENLLANKFYREPAGAGGDVKTPRQEQWYTPEGEAEIVKAQCIPHRLVPEDVAALIVFLASDDAKGMTGHEHFVDAGWR